MIRNRGDNLLKSLKDYAIPLLAFILILFLFYSIFSWPNDEKNNIKKGDNEVIITSEAQVILWSEDSKAYIIYESWKKVEIEENIIIGKSEKIIVEEGNIIIEFPYIANIKLSKNWEFTYKADWSFYLESSDLWVEALKDIDIFMNDAIVSVPLWSIANLNQNQIEAKIYSIDGIIGISTLSGVKSTLSSSNQIIIKNSESIKEDIDLESLKSPIDDYFKLSKWFKYNWWEKLLKSNESEESKKLITSTGSLIKENTNSLITFDDIADESYVNINPIDLKWRYSSLEIWKITINNKEVYLDSELSTFSLKWFNLNLKTNDLIIKLFDHNQNIIWKKILTIYSNNSSVVEDNTIPVTPYNLENFKVNPANFIIYEPTKTWKITTTSSRLTIKGKVIDDNVSNVVINNYTLKSYNGSTWRYHAWIEQETLKEWVNTYEIKYLNKDWIVIYKEYYSIYKEIKKIESNIPEKIVGVISSEINID